MNFTTEFDNLIEEAEKFEDGQKEKSRILERAIKLAQEHKDREREFDAKLDYIKSTVYASEIDKALATFPWLLNYIDEQEKNKGDDGVSFHFFYGSPKDHVLWMYKWVLSDLPYYPNISKEKIDAALADMARRYQQEGHGDLTVKEYELILAREMGHRAKANEIWAYLKANKDKSSDMSDCPTCLRHDEVETYIFLKEYDQAIEHARPILEGEIRCSSKPYSTYGLMFPVFIHLGQFDKARHYYQKYLEESKKPENEENPKSNLLLFYALTGQFDKGIVYLETYLEQVLSTIEQDDPFKHYVRAWRLFDEMEKARIETVNINFPASFALKNASNNYEVSALKEWFKTANLALAERFNKRNENTFFNEKIDWIFELKSFPAEA